MFECKCSNSSCILGKSTNKYGGVRTDSCFEVQIADLKGLSVHLLNYNVVGFTFHSIYGTNKSYFENKWSTIQYIDLTNIEISGVEMQISKGIESLIFQLKNLTSNEIKSTPQIGQSNSCSTYLNSTLLNSKCLTINSIHGCVNNQNSTFFPYMAFSYEFSICVLRGILLTSVTILSNIF